MARKLKGKPRGRPFKKGDKKPEKSGRKTGVRNHRTIFVQNLIEDAIIEMGGLEGLVKWAKKPGNEGAFWTQLVPRLIPIQLQTSGTSELVIRIDQEELAQKLIENGLPPTIFSVEIPKLEDMREINGKGGITNGNRENDE